MKRILLFTIAVLAAITLNGAPACDSLANGTSLLGLGAVNPLNPTAGGGCDIANLIFGNFSIIGSATGNGVIPTAAQLGFSIDEPTTNTATGEKAYGFEFAPNLAVTGVGSVDLLLQYDIFETGSSRITSNHLLVNGLTSSALGASIGVSETDCGKTTLAGGCAFLPLLFVTAANPHQDQEDIGPFVAEHITKDIFVNVQRREDFAAISLVRDDVDQKGGDTLTGSPEPSTLGVMLLGSLLLVAGKFYRRV